MERCFEALAVKKLADDIDSHPNHGVRLNDAEIACLSTVLGTCSREALVSLSQHGTIELTNVDPLISDKIHTLIAEKVPADVLDIFRQTLDIVSFEVLPELSANIHNVTQQLRLEELVRREDINECPMLSTYVLPTLVMWYLHPQEMDTRDTLSSNQANGYFQS
ncbi:hypothetical protein BJY52DRAFT_1220089 [Lactarius psammicola]|nr:hypothetical protein BJY52DRAFT_1220089 [Lactarius psammicola]